jgi:hypothetical protein
MMGDSLVSAVPLLTPRCHFKYLACTILQADVIRASTEDDVPEALKGAASLEEENDVRSSGLSHQPTAVI